MGVRAGQTQGTLSTPPRNSATPGFGTGDIVNDTRGGAPNRSSKPQNAQAPRSIGDAYTPSVARELQPATTDPRRNAAPTGPGFGAENTTSVQDMALYRALTAPGGGGRSANPANPAAAPLQTPLDVNQPSQAQTYTPPPMPLDPTPSPPVQQPATEGYDWRANPLGLTDPNAWVGANDPSRTSDISASVAGVAVPPTTQMTQAATLQPVDPRNRTTLPINQRQALANALTGGTAGSGTRRMIF